MPNTKSTPSIPVSHVRAAKEYLNKRAITMKKGYPPVVYQEELEIVLEMLETGAIHEWLESMRTVIPEF